MPPSFPSVEFFQALRQEMQKERERFSRLGFFDTTLGIRVLDDGAPAAEFVLTFEVFDCVAVEDGTSARERDFVLEGPLASWRDMLDNIHALGAADTAHSVNTLTHFGESLRVCYDDPDGHDKLYRFAESVQEFFDLASRVDFTYRGGARPPARQAPMERSGT